MKLVIEPKRMKELIEKCLVNGQFSAAKLTADKDELKIGDCSGDSIGVMGYFKKEYFIEYEVEEEETIIFDSDLLKLVKSFKDEKITLESSINDKKEIVIIITGKNDDGEVTVSDVEPNELPCEPRIDKERGFLLDKTDDTLVLSAKIRKKEFDLPSIGENKLFKLTSDGKDIFIRLKDSGTKYNRKVTVDKCLVIKEFAMNLEVDIFNSLISLMADDFWLTINSKGGISVSFKDTEFAVTFFMVESGDNE